MEGDSSGKSSDDLITYTQDVYKAVVSSTRCAKTLPKLGENYELYNSYPVFAELMTAEGERVLQLISKLCKHTGAKTHLLDNTLLMEERMERLGEVNDFLLERVGNLLDEAAGLRRPEELVVVGPDTRAPLSRTIHTSWNRALHNRPATTPGTSEAVSGQQRTSSNGNLTSPDGKGTKPMLLLGSMTVSRPQVAFMDQIDNSNKPFVPNIRFKHNAKENVRPEKLRILDDNEGVDMDPTNSDMEISSHPYKYELDHFEPEPWQFEYPKEISKARSVEETPLIYVANEQQLEELCQSLKSVKEFAVDLEHHSYRTFQGLTCLLQISTRTHDYIIDPFPLWRHMHILNDPFTDPSIVKVFHGANFDIIWLQRDFGVYVVNMFDTGQAMRLLNFNRLSLAYLVRHYCCEELEKQYQLADWRIRPLPDELITYARKDTHFLLTCYDYLRRDLLDAGNEQQNLLRTVYTRSREICLTEYRKPLYKPDDHLILLEKSRKRFNARQLYALKELYAWRDHLARSEDESYPYILPDHMMLQIAEVLPREMAGIWACCCPVPPLVRRDSHPLHRMILHARVLPLDNNDGRNKSVEMEKAQQKTVADVGGDEVPKRMLKTHDFSHSSAEEEIAPLAQRLAAIPTRVSVKETPCLLFDILQDAQPSPKKRKKTSTNVVDEVNKLLDESLTPYDKYLLALASTSKANEETGDQNEDAKPVPKKRKMYSHLDPPDNETTSHQVATVEADEPASSTSQNANEDVSPKVPKKKRVASPTKEATLVESMPETKVKKKKRLDTSQVESYDYSAAVKTVFSQAHASTQRDIFDPHKDFLNKRGKKAKNKNFQKTGATGTIGGSWKKRSAAALASFDSSGGAFGKGKKK